MRPILVVLAVGAALSACSAEKDAPVPASTAPAVETVAAVKTASIPAGEPVLTCPTLPAAVRRAVEAHVGWRVLAFRDLNPDDQQFWPEWGEGRCPGVAAVDFAGDGRTGYAVALVSGAERPLQEQLIAFVPTADGFAEHVLSDPGEHAIPAVVRTLAPGTYTEFQDPDPDVAPEGRGVIHSAAESVAFIQLEAWSVQYFYKDGRFMSLQTSD